MATRAINLHRPWFNHGPDAISIRTQDDIRAAALCLEDKVRSEALRIVAWPDLSTLARMLDEEERPLDAEVFGWSGEELAAWRNLDKTMQSPLLRAARTAEGPFWANSHAIHGRAANGGFDQIDLDQFAAFTPVRAAIVIPVHLPFGQIGAAILASNDPAKNTLAFEFLRAVETLAPAIAGFISDYVAINRDDRFMPKSCVLSSREIECLSWIAHGKTDHEISIILGCSHAGVRYHITRTCAKLNAMNRTHAVFRAVQLGYISLAPS